MCIRDRNFGFAEGYNRALKQIDAEYYVLLNSDVEAVSYTHLRYFLKVQDGCNYYCTYCTIPFARGNSRNPSSQSLVAQCEDVYKRQV